MPMVLPSGPDRTPATGAHRTIRKHKAAFTPDTYSQLQVQSSVLLADTSGYRGVDHGGTGGTSPPQNFGWGTVM